MQRACVVSQVLRVNSPFNTITLTLFFFFSFQSACAWSAHQDHRPSWSHRRCVQEEVNSLLPLVSIKCHSSQNPSVRVLLVWSSLESVNYYNLVLLLVWLSCLNESKSVSECRNIIELDDIFMLLRRIFTFISVLILLMISLHVQQITLHTKHVIIWSLLCCIADRKCN